MLNVIFHNLQDSSFKLIKKLDVALIERVYYYKCSFKMFDRKNNYKMVVLHSPLNWSSNSMILVSYPTEQRCKNACDEILFKKNALDSYVKKLQNEILPRSYEDTMYDIPKEQYLLDVNRI